MKTLYEIEERYKNELERLEEWAYLRSYYRHALATKNIETNVKLSKLKIIKEIFFGFSSWFRKYDYFVFSDTSGRKRIDNKWFDPSVDYIMKVLGQKRGLLVEEPNPNYFKKRELYTKHISSRRLLDALALILAKIIKKNIYYPVLEKINLETNTLLDYEKQINLFNARYILHKWLFKLYEVKFIIVKCYYSRQYVVKVANDLNIEIVEVQHGVVTNKNDAYNSLIKLDKRYFPNYLLSFGESEKYELSDNGLINKEVFPVGSFYLDYLKSSFHKNINLKNITKKYKKTVGISLQKGSEDLMLKFIIKIAPKSQDILYIIIPRFFNPLTSTQYIFPKNTLFYPSLDCYQVVMHCDYHCTYYSACIVEVPSLGIPNILVDFDEKATVLYGNLEGKTTTIVKTEKEFLTIVTEDVCLDIDVVKNNNFYISNNYKRNIEKIVKKNFLGILRK